MKTIPSIVALLLLLNPLAAQQTGQPTNPAVPGGTTRPNANTGGASAGGGFVAGGQASAAATTGTPTRPSATYGGLGMPGAPGAGGGGFGTGTVVPGSLPASDEFAAGLLSEEVEQDLTSAAAAYRRTIQAFDRQRTEAANAIFRLGEVYRKMGRLEEAKVQYARILREFPDLVRLTELSHRLLLGEQPRAGTVRGPEAPTAAADPAAHTRTGPDAFSPELVRLVRERYGLSLLDPAVAARFGRTDHYEVETVNTILNRLRQIEGAIQQWALENRQPVGTQPTEKDIIGYLPGGLPVPIAGERYELKPVGEPPVAVLTRPVGNRKAGDRLTIGPSTVPTKTARIPAVAHIAVLVSSNGTIQLDARKVEQDHQAALLRAQVDQLRKLLETPGTEPSPGTE